MLYHNPVFLSLCSHSYLWRQEGLLLKAAWIAWQKIDAELIVILDTNSYGPFFFIPQFFFFFCVYDLGPCLTFYTRLCLQCYICLLSMYWFLFVVNMCILLMSNIICIVHSEDKNYHPSLLVYTSEKTILEKWNECRDGKYKHWEKRGELYICRSHHKFSTRPPTLHPHRFGLCSANPT